MSCVASPPVSSPASPPVAFSSRVVLAFLARPEKIMGRWLARLRPGPRHFCVGMIQMFWMSTNIRNIAGGHLIWAVACCYVNTHILRDVYLRVQQTKDDDEAWQIYTLGCCVGVACGILFHAFVLSQFALFHYRAAR